MDEPRASDALFANSQAVPAQSSLESTYELVERAKTGDRDALDRLFARFLPSLRRWASGRLPRWTRDLMDTDDLVQETVMRARQPDRRIRVAARRRAAGVSAPGDRQPHSRRGPSHEALAAPRRTSTTTPPTATASPLEAAIGVEAVERYEAALARLRPEEREAIVARIEMDGTYQDVARALGKPSADAARMAVSRALLRLAEEMSRGEALRPRRCCRSPNRLPTATSIDWAAAEARAGGADEAVVRQLRVISRAGRAPPQRARPSPCRRRTRRARVSGSAAPAIGSWGHLTLLERLGGGTFG